MAKSSPIPLRGTADAFVPATASKIDDQIACISHDNLESTRPASGYPEPQPAPVADFSPVPVRTIADAAMHDSQRTDDRIARDSKVHAVSPAGPRKLIRPSLVARGSTISSAGESRLHGTPLRGKSTANAFPPSVRAETFYLQKQAQQRTPMLFVLEDGEHIEGVIEWYDINSIKIRNGSRILIYKSSIKYMCKAGENSSHTLS
jgi:sRNA-binding regulator protein Hfq